MKSKLKKSLSLLLALVMAMSCMSLSAFAAEESAPVAMSAGEFADAIKAVSAYETKTTVDFSSLDGVGHSTHDSEGEQVYILGGFGADSRTTDITIKNVTFNAGTQDKVQLYLYTSATVTFENCTFNGVGVSMNGAGTGSKGIFKSCTFSYVNNSAIKYVQNIEVTGCTFDNCKRAIFPSCMKSGAISGGNSTVCKIDGNTFKNFTANKGILKFYEYHTDKDTVLSITGNTVESSCTDAFIVVDFNDPNTAEDYTYKFAFTGNTGITSANLNHNDTEKTLYIDGSYLTDVEPTATADTDFYQVGNVWHIANLAGLKAFRDSVNDGTSYAGKTIQLDADIDLSTDEDDSWTPIGTAEHKFEGTNDSNAPVFDGEGHYIRNLTINSNDLDYAGLFGYLNYATVQNINMDNVSISAHDYVGSVVGYSHNWSDIINCHITGTIRLSGNHYVGGIIGQSYANIRNCSVHGTGASTSYIHGADMAANAGDGDDIGGILGLDAGSTRVLDQCSVSNITIEGFRQVGGIVGLVQGKPVTNCTVSDVVIRCIADAYTASNKAWKMGFGGLVGMMHSTSASTVSNCSINNVTLESTDAGKSAAHMGYVTGGEYYSGNPNTSTFSISNDNNTGSSITVTNVTRAEGLQAPAQEHILLDGPVAAAPTYVAEVGEVGYTSLAEAISAVPTNGTVKLLADVTSTVSIDNGKTFTLDLNGKNIVPTSGNAIHITSGHLTINSSVAGNTDLKNKLEGKTTTLYADGKGATVTIKAGYFVGNTGNVAAIFATNGAVITINDCVVYGNPESAGKIEGKVFYSGTNGNTFAAVGDGKQSPGKIIVNGGVFHGRMSSSSWGNYVIYGGTFDRNQVKNYYNPVDANGNPAAKPSEGNIPTPKDSNDTRDSYEIADPNVLTMAEASWLAEGYGVRHNSDNTWTVFAPIQYYNTWSVPSVYYFGDEDPVPSRTTRGTMPSIKRVGEGSYHAAEDFVTISWSVTDSSATEVSGAATNIASVDENGLVTFTQPGTVKVWLTMTDAAGTKSSSKTVNYSVAPAYVVSADGQTKTAYSSLYAAFNKAQNGETVCLGKDGSGANLAKLTLSDAKAVTVDLNGYTYTFSQNYRTGAFGALFTVTKGTLNVINSKPTSGGIVVSGTNARAFIVDGRANTAATEPVLTIGEGVSVSSAADCCVTIIGKATLNTAGNLSSPADFAIAGNGTSGYGGYTINVTGGSITSSNESAIYHPNTGTLTISDGTITGATGVYQKSGTMTITNGTINATGAAAEYSFNGNGANATGDAVVIDNCGYPGGAPSVSIDGGTFTSANGKGVASYVKDNTFEPVIPTYPTGKELVKSGDKTWTVADVQTAAATTVEGGDTRIYETVKAAVADAAEGTEITVKKDATLGDGTASSNITVAADSTVTVESKGSATGSNSKTYSAQEITITKGSEERKAYVVSDGMNTAAIPSESVASGKKTNLTNMQPVEELVNVSEVLAAATADKNVDVSTITGYKIDIELKQESNVNSALANYAGASNYSRLTAAIKDSSIQAFEVYPEATVTTTTTDGESTTDETATFDASEMVSGEAYTFTRNFGIENAGKYVKLLNYKPDGSVKSLGTVQLNAVGDAIIPMTEFCIVTGQIVEENFQGNTVRNYNGYMNYVSNVYLNLQDQFYYTVQLSVNNGYDDQNSYVGSKDWYITYQYAGGKAETIYSSAFADFDEDMMKQALATGGIYASKLVVDNTTYYEVRHSVYPTDMDNLIRIKLFTSGGAERTIYTMTTGEKGADSMYDFAAMNSAGDYQGTMNSYLSELAEDPAWANTANTLMAFGAACKAQFSGN